MAQNNAFTVAKRTLEGQDMIYQSLKLSNGIWALVGKSKRPSAPPPQKKMFCFYRYIFCKYPIVKRDGIKYRAIFQIEVS
jgi:Beta2-adaptin appendage, C-terminal sub-domain